MAISPACFLLVLVALWQESTATPSIYQPLVQFVHSRQNLGLIPIQNAGDKVRVIVQAAVQSIDSVDREKSQATVSLWLSMSWHSELTWNPADYNGIFRVNVPNSFMWTPGLVLRNAVTRPVDLSPPVLVVMSNGAVTMKHHYHVTLACDVNNNECQADVGSRIYSSDHLELETHENSPFDLRGYLGGWPNRGGRFQAKDVRFEKGNFSIAHFADTFDVVKVKFHIKDTQAHFRRGPSKMIFQWA